MTDNIKKILIADQLGYLDKDGKGVEAEVKAYIESQGAHFHYGSASEAGDLEAGEHFFYMPELNEATMKAEAADGRYDMVNLAATFVSPEAKFPQGGVRWGAGTNNFPEAEWKEAGIPLMNVPAGNSVRTALTATDALLAIAVDLDIKEVHQRVTKDSTFTTVPDINDYPTNGLEGRRIAILGITGNIGSEMARVAKAFRMEVVGWGPSFTEQDAADIGVEYAETMEDAARGADIVTPHFPYNGKNAGVIGAEIFNAMNKGGVVMNFARGELIDVDALEDALYSDQISKVAVDADITRTPEGNLKPDAPLKPYLSVHDVFADRMLLLPHIATDTDHKTRVGLAKRGVDQTLSLLRNNVVINSVQGGVPEGYKNGGTVKPPIGKVTGAEIVSALTELGADKLTEIAELSAKLAGQSERAGIQEAAAVVFQRLVNTVAEMPTTNRIIR
jgi:lactate dehydrogenase-like 2-hydroxyacid dehydrogenase